MEKIRVKGVTYVLVDSSDYCGECAACGDPILCFELRGSLCADGTKGVWEVDKPNKQKEFKQLLSMAKSALQDACVLAPQDTTLILILSQLKDYGKKHVKN